MPHWLLLSITYRRWESSYIAIFSLPQISHTFQGNLISHRVYSIWSGRNCSRGKDSTYENFGKIFNVNVLWVNHIFSFLIVSSDNLMRQRMDREMEHLRSNVHRILSEQQQEFAQAFGLHDEHSSSEVSHILVHIHSGELLPITLQIAVTTFFPLIGASSLDSFHPSRRIALLFAACASDSKVSLRAGYLLPIWGDSFFSTI